MIMVPNVLLDVAMDSSKDPPWVRNSSFSLICSRERYTSTWLPMEPATTTNAAKGPRLSKASTLNPAVSTFMASDNRYGSLSSFQVTANVCPCLIFIKTATIALLDPISMTPVAKVPYTTWAVELDVPANKGVDANENTMPARYAMVTL